jgi:hypothetical protein
VFAQHSVAGLTLIDDQQETHIFSNKTGTFSEIATQG